MANNLVRLTPVTGMDHVHVSEANRNLLVTAIIGAAADRGIKNIHRVAKVKDEIMFAIAEVFDGFGSDSDV